MKNYIEHLIKSKIILNIKGKNIERFIKRLKNNNIDILKINKILDDEIEILIYYKDYNNILKIKTIYEITKKNYQGIINFKYKILNNKFIILAIFLTSIFLYLLSNIIFEIEILTNDSNMSKVLLSELNKYGIEKYKFKKNYNELEIIKSRIINSYRDKIEWLEIENIGTKYIIKYEPRISNDVQEKNVYRNIISSKDAIITKMEVKEGQIIKEVNSYVKKGDVIVSGYIFFNNNIKNTVSSTGTIYGETWYKVSINYPFKYYENKETGNKKNVLVINFLNKKYEMFNLNKYKTKNIKEKIILKNNLLPIYISLDEQKETNIINENNSKKMAINKAIEKAKKSIEDKLDSGEYIKDYKVTDEYTTSTGVTLDIFFSVIENITEYQTIKKYEEILE